MNSVLRLQRFALTPRTNGKHFRRPWRRAARRARRGRRRAGIRHRIPAHRAGRIRAGRGNRQGATVGGRHQRAIQREQVAAHAARRRRGVDLRRARFPFRGGDQHFQRAGLAVDADRVAVAQLRQRPAARGFQGDVDRGGDLARCAGQAAVGDQRHAPAWFCSMPSSGVSECISGMPFACGPWKRTTATKSRGSAPAACSLFNACGLSTTTAGASMRRCSGLERGQLEHRAAEIAVQQAQTALRLERVRDRAQHRVVAAGRRGRRVRQRIAVDARFVGVGAHAAGHDGGDVRVHQPGVEQTRGTRTAARRRRRSGSRRLRRSDRTRASSGTARDRVDVLHVSTMPAAARPRPSGWCGWWNRRSRPARRWR